MNRTETLLLSHASACVKDRRWGRGGETNVRREKTQIRCACVSKESKGSTCESRCSRVWVGEEGGREGERRIHICIRICTYIRVCVCVCQPAFVLAWVHLHRGERIWQACLLSPQNNCLWITWGESHWRYLENDTPWWLLESCSYPVRARALILLCLMCAYPWKASRTYSCVCVCPDPRWYAVFFILPKTSRLFITRADGECADTRHKHVLHPNPSSKGQWEENSKRAWQTYYCNIFLW